MKKIYRKRKSKISKEQALEQFRKTRAKIEKDNPKLLDMMKAKIEKAKSNQVVVQKNKMPDKEDVGGAMVQIDRAKNLETILKFLAANPGHSELKKEIQSFLQ